ncbi:MAG TPA: hypothetical protein VG269_13330 [Tepidisphaeraceae bacterium]|jgi:hypothetical protein|nr:hypothetical protein [Tepidisphaeraceae bacterium]
MPDHGKNFDEVVQETAARKLRAAQARFSGTELSTEAPKEIYAAACRTIGDALASDGYTFKKSGPALNRKAGDFSFEITFQSSRDNIAGELIAVWIHTNIRSMTLKKWRETHPSLVQSAGIAGGQIGNLLPNHSWMEWNVASPASRAGQIADAVVTIRRIVFPYFAMFEDVPDLVSRLVANVVPFFSPASALDFLMCFATPADAMRAASNMLRTLPEAEVRYSAALARFRQDGLPPRAPMIHGELLAYATVLQGFPDLRELH